MNEQLTIGGGCINPSMTVKQVADSLGVSSRTIRRYAVKLFPEIVQNGNATMLSEIQVTKIKLDLEKAKNLDNAVQLPKTDLEKELLIQQAMQFQAEKVERLQIENAEQKKQLEEAQPKVEFYNTVGNSQGLHTVAEVAKMLGTGRNRLFQWMREEKILRDNNEPYQKFIDSGYFEVRESPYRNIINVQTFLTAKGLQWIQRKYRL